MDHDAFSKWLGIEVIAVEAGFATLRMTVREEMTNGFGIAHGGISYSLADSALAFASNGGGNQSVSLETAIHHLKPVQSGDTLEAVLPCSTKLAGRVCTKLIFLKMMSAWLFSKARYIERAMNGTYETDLYRRRRSYAHWKI